MHQQQTDGRKFRHDFLGSLNSIRLSMEAIKIADNAEEMDLFLECISKEVDKAQKLVDEFLPSKAHLHATPFQSQIRVQRPAH